MKVFLWMEQSTDPGFGRSHLDPPEGALSGMQSPEMRCLWSGRIRRDSPRLAGILDYLRVSPVHVGPICTAGLIVSII